MGESLERDWENGKFFLEKNITDGENEEGQTNSGGSGWDVYILRMDRDGNWDLMKFNF